MTQRCVFRAVEEAWNTRFVFSFYVFFADSWEMNVGGLCPHPHPRSSSTITEEVLYFHSTEIENKNPALRVLWGRLATLPVSGWATPLWVLLPTLGGVACLPCPQWNLKCQGRQNVGEDSSCPLVACMREIVTREGRDSLGHTAKSKPQTC